MFPNYKLKVKKRFLWFKEANEPDGWEDLGKINKINKIENGEQIIRILTCGICFTIVRIGKENGKTFRYCPRCMVKVEL